LLSDFFIGSLVAGLSQEPDKILLSPGIFLSVPFFTGLGAPVVFRLVTM
jgi:hypothetical protein